MLIGPPSGSIGTVVRLAAARWGRSHVGTATWAAAQRANVVAIAGRVRRLTRPRATPRTKANAAWAMGTTPRAAKATGSSRGEYVSVAPPPLTARSLGLLHQLTARLVRPAAVMEAAAPRPSLVASQRVRVTPWFHAR